MSVVAAYHVFVFTLFPVQGVMWTVVHITPCTGYAATTLIIIEYS
jgi:hypothetical protein